jgi:hypothetical protein
VSFSTGRTAFSSVLRSTFQPLREPVTRCFVMPMRIVALRVLFVMDEIERSQPSSLGVLHVATGRRAVFAGAEAAFLAILSRSNR